MGRQSFGGASAAAAAGAPDGAEAGATAPGRQVLSAGIVSAGPCSRAVRALNSNTCGSASAGPARREALHSLCSRRGPREAAQKAATQKAGSPKGSNPKGSNPKAAPKSTSWRKSRPRWW